MNNNQMQKVDKVPGAYVITHITSGKEYIGSTNNLNRRQIEHRCRLNSSVHEVKVLQELFNEDNLITFKFYPASNREEAYDLEQKLINDKINNGNLLNKSKDSRSSKGIIPCEDTRIKMGNSHRGSTRTDETKAKMSLAAIGKVFTEETKNNMSIAQKELLLRSPEQLERLKKNAMAFAKPIILNGVGYESIRSASRELNIDRNKIKKLINK